MRLRLLRSIAAAVAIAACAPAFAQDPASEWTGDVDAGADTSRRPIVFVHGFAGSGEQYEGPAKLYASNGYPPTWINVYDYNSTGPDGGPEPLDAFIDAVRKRTGFDKIDLVGHSRGTMVSQTYLSDPARAAKVAHYANVGGRPAGNVGGVPTIVVGSHGDKLAGPGKALDGAQHAMFDKPDHLSVATGKKGFEAVYTFFNNGEKPKTTKVQPKEPIAVGGFAKYFGPNTPVAGAALEVYEVSAETGRRINEKPYATFTVADDGSWGPFRADLGQHYEFCLTPADGTPIHYYREPFVRTDLIVYLKARDATSESSKRVNALLGIDDESSVMVVSPLDGAVVAGRDSLKINGTEIVSEATALEKDTKVGFYIFDANDNQKTDATPPADEYFSGPFISGADVYIPCDEPGSVKVAFNGKTLNVPNWKAASEGQIVVQFN